MKVSDCWPRLYPEEDFEPTLDSLLEMSTEELQRLYVREKDCEADDFLTARDVILAEEWPPEPFIKSRAVGLLFFPAWVSACLARRQLLEGLGEAHETLWFFRAPSALLGKSLPRAQFTFEGPREPDPDILLPAMTGIGADWSSSIAQAADKLVLVGHDQLDRLISAAEAWLQPLTDIAECGWPFEQSPAELLSHHGREELQYWAAWARPWRLGDDIVEKLNQASSLETITAGPLTAEQAAWIVGGLIRDGDLESAEILLPKLLTVGSLPDEGDRTWTPGHRLAFTIAEGLVAARAGDLDAARNLLGRIPASERARPEVAISLAWARGFIAGSSSDPTGPWQQKVDAIYRMLKVSNRHAFATGEMLQQIQSQIESMGTEQRHQSDFLLEIFEQGRSLEGVVGDEQLLSAVRDVRDALDRDRPDLKERLTSHLISDFDETTWNLFDEESRGALIAYEVLKESEIAPDTSLRLRVFALGWVLEKELRRALLEDGKIAANEPGGLGSLEGPAQGHPPLRFSGDAIRDHDLRRRRNDACHPGRIATNDLTVMESVILGRDGLLSKIVRRRDAGE